MPKTAPIAARIAFPALVCATIAACGPTIEGGTTSPGSTSSSSGGASTSSTGTGGSPSTSSGVGGSGSTTSSSTSGSGGASTSSGVGGGGSTSSSSTGGTGCITPQDCPGVDTECGVRTCTSGVCGQSFLAAGTVSGTQTTGDCQRNACDGQGNLVAVADATDTPAPSSACVTGTCAGTTPTLTNIAAGAPCNENGGKVCNGAGVCVECASGADCASGVCTAGACQTATCTDGVKNANEADVDCGGPDCAPCATGKSCALDADCQMCPPAPNACQPSRCVHGTCGAQILYSASVVEMTVDATHLYWTTSGGTVMAAPKDGSGPIVTVASGQASPLGIAVDANQLYWTNTGDGTVMSAPLGASGGTPLASGLSALGLIRVGGGFAWVMSGSSLVKIPVGGGPPVTVVTEATKLIGLAIDANNIYWSTEAPPPPSPGQCTCGATNWLSLPGAPLDSGSIQGGPQCRMLRLSAGLTFVGGHNISSYCPVNQIDSFFLHPIDNVLGHTYQWGSGFGPLLGYDTATDGVAFYWDGSWVGGRSVNKSGLPLPQRPLVDVDTYRLVLDDTYLYMAVWGGKIARTYK